MKRREFIATAIASSVVACATKPMIGADLNSNRGRSLVVVELAGGNDGLNTFVPYKDSNYFKLRPDLGIKNSLPITNTIALHPALKDLQQLFEKNRLAVVQNVSYPHPNLSHFRSKDIWQSAQVEGTPNTGWLARYLDAHNAKTGDAIFLGEEYPLALTGKGDRYLQLSRNLGIPSRGKLGQAIQVLYHSPQANPLAEQVRRTILESEAAVKELTKDLDKRVSDRNYAPTAVGRAFALVSKILEASPQVVYLTIGGWDTHTNQSQRQQKLLEQLSLGLSALNRDLQARGTDRNVLVMVQSEFGRRAAQNGSGGTDHGTAGPVILLGPVKAGFYGGDPSLDSLENGNLPVKVDFRSIYAEILTRWYKFDAKSVLASDFPAIGFLS